jgi:hypothetical protein
MTPLARVRDCRSILDAANPTYRLVTGELGAKVSGVVHVSRRIPPPVSCLCTGSALGCRLMVSEKDGPIQSNACAMCWVYQPSHFVLRRGKVGKWLLFLEKL